MSKEEAINHFIECKADLENQNKIFEDTISQDFKNIIYDNQIRISELTRVIDYLKGEW